MADIVREARPTGSGRRVAGDRPRRARAVLAVVRDVAVDALTVSDPEASALPGSGVAR